MKGMIYFFVLLLSVSFVLGAVTNLQEIDYKKLVIEENAKTRAELKSYIDNKVSDYERQTNKFIDDNFVILDKMVSDKLRLAGFKFGMILFSVIVFSQLLVLFIKRKLGKKSVVSKSRVDTLQGETVSVFPQEESVDDATITRFVDALVEQPMIQLVKKPEPPRDIDFERQIKKIQGGA